jgi:hypothetical protein
MSEMVEPTETENEVVADALIMVIEGNVRELNKKLRDLGNQGWRPVSISANPATPEASGRSMVSRMVGGRYAVLLSRLR